MGTPESRLQELGYALPVPSTPVASYVPARRVGELLYVSGQIPYNDGALLAKGVVGEGVTLEQAHACARQCALNALAAVKAALGDLSRVAQVVRVGVFVACRADFTDHSKVANGASDLLTAVFGDAGRHARAAVGAPSLPLGAPVEVEMVVQVG